MAIAKKSKPTPKAKTGIVKDKSNTMWAKFSKTKAGAFITNRYFMFALVTLLYVLWVIWLGSYWWLIGELLIIDIYLTRFVRWAFWKPRKDKKMSNFKRKTLEWVDALIFAVIAASFIRIFFFEAFTIPTSSMEKTLLIGDYLFVSKVAYGPRVPNTPLSFPFVHHTLPFTTKTKSFVTWIQNEYRRLAGWGEIKRDDIVVFNYPDGDTVVVQNQAQGYYDIIRVAASTMKDIDKLYLINNKNDSACLTAPKGENDYMNLAYYIFNPEYNEIYTNEFIENAAKKLKENDIAFFDSKKNETLLIDKIKTDKDYYNLARKIVWDMSDIIVRPVDKRENYIKRCVAIPGDSLEVREGEVFVNNTKQKDIQGKQFNYYVILKPMNSGNFQAASGIDAEELKSYGINYEDIKVGAKTNYGINYIEYLDAIKLGIPITNQYKIPLTQENVSKVRAMYNVQSVTKYTNEKGEWYFRIFPQNPSYNWNEDWFGPLWIPKAGVTINIDTSNIAPYERIIGYYEHNTLKIDGNKIFINGKETKTYTFKMNYYWMMGDNRHNSADSRFWGYVPEDHVVGKAWVIWFSKDKENGKIRWNRIFDKIHSAD